MYLDLQSNLSNYNLNNKFFDAYDFLVSIIASNNINKHNFILLESDLLECETLFNKRNFNHMMYLFHLAKSSHNVKDCERLLCYLSSLNRNITLKDSKFNYYREWFKDLLKGC